MESFRRIVFFGGAGVSTGSGIPDFRSPGGVYKSRWDGYAPEDILHKDFFFKHTDLFYRFYYSKMVYRDARPNLAHLALASLERAGLLSGVVTQNIDGLHQRAGSVRVAELHGSVYKNKCIRCNNVYPLPEIPAANQDIPVCSGCGGVLKPDVVLYGEQLSDEVVDKAIHMIKDAECMIVGGTSLTVYPAASFINHFPGKCLILINKEETPYDSRADYIFRRPIDEVLAEAVF